LSVCLNVVVIIVWGWFGGGCLFIVCLRLWFVCLCDYGVNSVVRVVRFCVYLICLFIRFWCVIGWLLIGVVAVVTSLLLVIGFVLFCCWVVATLFGCVFDLFCCCLVAYCWFSVAVYVVAFCDVIMLIVLVCFFIIFVLLCWWLVF